MTFKNLLLLLALGFAISACGNAGGDSADADGMAEDTTAMAEETTDEAPEEDKSQRKSPPMTVEGEVGGAQITITYGAPSVRGRTIYGDLVPYNQIWRTGANEATKISLSEGVMVEGNALPPGTYSVFTIPGEEEWTIIFNEEAEQWGAYDYDESKDAVRVKVTPNKLEESVEVLAFTLEDNKIVLRWDDTEVPVSISPAND